MKGQPIISSLLLNTLDLLEDMLFFASRPGLGRMSNYWGYTEHRAAYRAFQRWESQQYLEKVRQGDQLAYRLADKGKELLQRVRPSAAHRRRAWDERWRMVVFDFPETARKARDAFRRMLQTQRMGCLQKSVWISPNPIISEWKKLLRELKLTEWVLLFESAELGPVDDVDIARKVWKLDGLEVRYQRYLTECGGLPRQLRSARMPTLAGELGHKLRRESVTYFSLLDDDPLLPASLLPSTFAGIQADALHSEIRSALRERIM